MGVKILSLYDGMACGMIAMQLAGVEVESYDAYEIDKYAIKTAQHNFPMIKEHGDVFDADFTQYEGIDFLIGGSPCTYWSIAQTKNRETVASGMGWELFSQYVRALHEAKPKYFIYENNKSMSKQIMASIDDAFGFEAICINSALVSAQNRQRLYWVGKRNEDGTYSKANVEQPADRGILLKDVLDSAVAMDLTCNDKSYTLTASYDGACAWNTIERHQRNMVAEPVGIKHLGSLYGQHSRWGVFDEEGKAPTLTASAGMGGGHLPMVKEAVQVGAMLRPDGEISTSAGFRIYSTEVKGRYFCANGGGAGAKTGLYAVPTPTEYSPLDNCDVVITDNNIRCSYKDGSGTAMGYSVYFDDVKSPTVISGHAAKMKIIERVSGKNQHPVYEVRNGLITIKGKQYPIKLKDGYYIIRKLTVRECMRLQTVPEWYEFPVSNSQAYKMLGNGWTCEVIAHLIRSCMYI